MKIRVTIRRASKVLHEGDYNVVQPGDVERAVAAAMATARLNVDPASSWGYSIEVDKAPVAP